MKNLLMAVCLILFATALCGCGSTRSKLMVSNAVERGEVQLGSFKYVVIYDSEKASFIELELEDLFEQNGLRVIGEADIKNPSITLGARYKESSFYNPSTGYTNIDLTVLLENMDDDKTLVTASGTSRKRDRAWQEVSKELNKALASMNSN